MATGHVVCPLIPSCPNLYTKETFLVGFNVWLFQSASIRIQGSCKCVDRKFSTEASSERCFEEVITCHVGALACPVES